MKESVLLWNSIFWAGMCYWFYQNLPLTTDYHRNSFLIDEATGKPTKPRDLIYLARVINQTQEYIESTDAEQRLYDTLYNVQIASAFSADLTYSNKQDLVASGLPVADQAACGEQLEWIIDHLKANKNYTFLKGKLGYELSNLMDTYGRPGSGLYKGQMKWFGSYSQCMKLSLNESNIKTRFCVSKMRPKWWPKDERVYPRLRIQLGLCLPDTCDSLSFVRHKSKIDTLAKFQLSEHYQHNLEFEDLFCLPDERSPIRKISLGGYIYLVVMGLWLVTVLICSFTYERCQSNERNAKCLKYLEALSLRRIMESFVADPFKENNKRSKVNLSVFTSLKVFMSLMVILGHSGMITFELSKSYGNRIDIVGTDEARIGLSLIRCVDTFFLLFGLLATYTLMRKFTLEQMSSPLVWLKINLNVFVRITFIYMIFYWFARLLAPLIGSGPWWDYGFDEFSLRGLCRNEEWWKSIPHFGNIGSLPGPVCLPPGWFVVCYAQLYLLIPLVTYLLCAFKSSTSRIVMTAGVSLMAAFSVAWRLYNQSTVSAEGLTFFSSFLVILLEKFESVGYSRTLTRVGTVTIGCLVGYWLKMYEDGKISKWPQWVTSRITLSLVFLSHVFIIMVPILWHKIFQITGRMTDLNEFIWSSIGLSVLWPVLNSILVIALTTTYKDSLLVRFGCHSFWNSFNKINMCLFLIHWEVQAIISTNSDRAPSNGLVTDIYNIWFASTSASIVISLLVHLLIEAPMNRLLGVVIQLQRDDSNKSSLKQVNSDHHD